MPKLNLIHSRDLLQKFDFQTLFTEELGWSQPASRQATQVTAEGEPFTLRQIAHLSGIVVLDVHGADGTVPPARIRAAVQKEVAKTHHENLLIFLDGAETQSLWYWVKREDGRVYPRDHHYAKGQPGDLFLGKLAAMVVDISELDAEGNVPIIVAARRLQDALDQEHVTKKFYADFKVEHENLLGQIDGIGDERDKRWYASVLLNRLMFIYFLQGKGFLSDGDYHYLQGKLDASKKRGANRYYGEFLRTLFFEGFAKPEAQRAPEARAMVGRIPYLSGSIFLPHPVETRWPNIHIPDSAFDGLFRLFGRYSWNLNDTPGGKDDEINPDVLGYIFEKYINQKAFGAYYTRPEITDYLCDQTVHRLILDRINTPGVAGVVPARHFDSIPELLMGLDAGLCRTLLFDVLPQLSLLDPACGSGAFLVAAMKTLINIYSAVTGKIDYLTDPHLTQWLQGVRAEHPSLNYYIKKRIITDNLFGVDIMEESTEIAKLRLFLALVASAQTVEQLEPLPNIDFNILAGNSLIGLMHVDDADFNKRFAQGDLFRKSYRETVAEKDRLIKTYRETSEYTNNLQGLRDNIRAKKAEAALPLNETLLADFKALGIKFEQATWDTSKGGEGKPVKRPLALSDIEELQPFHWGYEFDEVLNKRGGFDAIITNPPWEILKPQAKEFFQEYCEHVTVNKMAMAEFEERRAELLQQPELRSAWLHYLGRFPHSAQFYRSTSQYANQTPTINGKKAGSDINLYKLFTEQCFNLLRAGGQCGIVIPSGIYNDLGTRKLRELLFDKAHVTGLFCFENRKEIFEGVHRMFKFVVLTFAKGSVTSDFPTAFMRHDVGELKHFPKQGALWLTVDLIRRLSPDSLTIAEFKSETEVEIATKMARSPSLGDWSHGNPLQFSREFMSSDDHPKFNSAQNGLVVYEGKMFDQFDPYFEPAHWWMSVDELTKTHFYERGDWQHYRFAIRRIASNTNNRTLIACMLPPNSVVVHSVFVNVKDILPPKEALYLVALLNSFVADFQIRGQVTSNVSQFALHQLPVPRLSERDAAFAPVVSRTARLICTTPEFDELAHEVGMKDHHDGATDPAERAKLRAELDGLVAHLYGLTENEFAHVLSTFPLVAQATKDAALAEFRSIDTQARLAAADPAAAQVKALISTGESKTVEFKQTLEYVDDAQIKNLPNAQQVKAEKQKAVFHSVLKTICAFLNSDGGTLLIGVHDDGYAVGIEPDLRTVKNKNADGFEQKLRSFLMSRLEPKPLLQVDISFPIVDGEMICRVDVKADADIFHLDGAIYVRNGNRTDELKAVTLTQWIAKRSKK